MRANQQAQAPEEEEDPNALVERQHLAQNNAMTKRDILETLYQDTKPEAVQMINKYLKTILEKKPWSAQSVDTAQNRYARAYEIVQDYLHLVEEKAPVAKQPGMTDGQRIIANSQKPRSPTEVGKSARPEGAEYLKSIQGKKEFREYRQRVMRGEA
jgi:predicted nucleic acid-binding protein